MFWVEFDGQDVVFVLCWVCLGCKYSEVCEWLIWCYYEVMFYFWFWSDLFMGVIVSIFNFVMFIFMYDDEYLLELGMFCYCDVQLFLKSFCNCCGYGFVCYFFVGEYGGCMGCFYYYFFFFGEDFSDCYQFYMVDFQFFYYSFEFDELWIFG